MSGLSTADNEKELASNSLQWHKAHTIFFENPFCRSRITHITSDDVINSNVVMMTLYFLAVDHDNGVMWLAPAG
jgi:hypothetical protein